MSASILVKVNDHADNICFQTLTKFERLGCKERMGYHFDWICKGHIHQSPTISSRAAIALHDEI